MQKVSIAIPAYNEENRLPQSLEKISTFIKNHPELEIELIVIDDGSKDKTWEVIQNSPIINKSAQNSPNIGKAATLRKAVAMANNDWVYLCDADLSTPIEELLNFLEFAKNYDCVIGSRALDESLVETSLLRKLLGRFGNLLINLLLGLNVKDTQCGFKLLGPKSKQLFLKTQIKRWGFDFEMLYFIRRNNIEIKEIPVQWVNTADSRVTPLSYFRTLKELFQIWWMYRIAGDVPRI